MDIKFEVGYFRILFLFLTGYILSYAVFAGCNNLFSSGAKAAPCNCNHGAATAKADPGKP